MVRIHSVYVLLLLYIMCMVWLYVQMLCMSMLNVVVFLVLSYTCTVIFLYIGTIPSELGNLIALSNMNFGYNSLSGTYT